MHQPNYYATQQAQPHETKSYQNLVEFRQGQKQFGTGTHFKVGFLGKEETLDKSKGRNMGFAGNTFQENKLKGTSCSVSLGSDPITVKTSNQSFFRWIQPKLE